MEIWIYDNKIAKTTMNFQSAPNKACTRQVGFCATYRLFPCFGFILLSSRV